MMSENKHLQVRVYNIIVIRNTPNNLDNTQIRVYEKKKNNNYSNTTKLNPNIAKSNNSTPHCI